MAQCRWHTAAVIGFCGTVPSLGLQYWILCSISTSAPLKQNPGNSQVPDITGQGQGRKPKLIKQFSVKLMSTHDDRDQVHQFESYSQEDGMT